MKHTQKMVLVPENEVNQRGRGEPMDEAEPVEAQDSSPKGNKIRRYAAERQRMMLSIVLKLASKSLYDSAGRFDIAKGKVYIAPLLMYALSPGRTYPALDEFVDVLYRAGVTPDEVINSNVKDLLRNKTFNQANEPIRPDESHQNQTGTLASIPSRPPPLPPRTSFTSSTQTPQQTQEEIDRLALIAKRRLARRANKVALNDHYDMLKLAGVAVPQKRASEDDDGHSDKRQRSWSQYSDDES